jgi:hypothetical protein
MDANQDATKFAACNRKNYLLRSTAKIMQAFENAQRVISAQYSLSIVRS